MSATLLQFPPRGPFCVYVGRLGSTWLVLCRDHGWLHGNFNDALADAFAVARGFNVDVRVVVQ